MGNELGPEGGAALAEGLKGNSTLQSLDLASNNLGAEGGAALAAGIKGNSALRRLELADNNICGHWDRGKFVVTTEGIIALCEGLKGSAVTSLGNFGANNLTKKAEE